MSGKGPSATAFEGMSHEQMLAWLDQANSGTVQSAADRLTAAAKEIRKIGEELKVRPQHVEWKGEGADAFRGWAADLANSTLRLGDFSDDAAKWLGQASNAIAHAQASIPRDTNSARANLDAATLAHTDPDAPSAHTKSASELAAVAANKEKARQEAASQMLKLGQSYRLSATQLEGLERPTFPPPPKAVQPPDARGRGSQSGMARPGDGDSRTSATSVRSESAARSLAQEPVGRSAVADIPADLHAPKPASHDAAVSVHVPSATTIDSPVRMSVDSVGTLPHVPNPGAGTSDGPSGMGQSSGPVQPPPGGVTPAWGGNTGNPVSSAVRGRAVSGSARSEGVVGRPTTTARPTVNGRSASMPGQGAPVPNSGRASGSSASGVVGGRPTATPTGRPARAIPRGTVVGAENPTGPGPGPGPGPGRGPVGSTAGSGRAVSPNRGVMGSTPQQPGRVPFSRPGAGGPGGTVASGAAVRDGVTGGTPSAGRPGADRGNVAARRPTQSMPSASSSTPSSTSSTPSTRAGGSGARSDRAAEERQRREKRRRTETPPPIAPPVTLTP